MSKKLIKISIANRNYSKLSNISISITSILKKQLEKIKSTRYKNQFEKLTNAGFRGGKHLLEILTERYGRSCKIILSHERSKIDDKTIQINYDDFWTYGRSKFYGVYRQTGLETSTGYLKQSFPKIFGDLEITPKLKETRKIIKNLPSLSEDLYNKDKNELITNVAKIISDYDIDPSKITPEALAEMNAASSQAFHRQKINEFKKRLKKNYPETKGKDSWQNWIYNNAWILGGRYLKPITKKRVGLDAVPDYLFPTTDNFLDILEIKLPKEKVILKDKKHPDSFYWAEKVSKAIGQIINYLHQLELHQLEIAKKLKVKTIKPRAILVIGASDEWNDDMWEAFRRLNYSLHEIEVITYSQVLQYGNRLLEIYSRKKK